jgi:hypothetical protein
MNDFMTRCFGGIGLFAFWQKEFPATWKNG